LYLELQIGTVSRNSINTSIKIEHVNLVNGGEEALGKRIALGVRAVTESGAVCTPRGTFRRIDDVAGHDPT